MMVHRYLAKLCPYRWPRRAAADAKHARTYHDGEKLWPLLKDRLHGLEHLHGSMAGQVPAIIARSKYHALIASMCKPEHTHTHTLHIQEVARRTTYLFHGLQELRLRWVARLDRLKERLDSSTICISLTATLPSPYPSVTEVME